MAIGALPYEEKIKRIQIANLYPDMSGRVGTHFLGHNPLHAT
jgi:hypothetical protein